MRFLLLAPLLLLLLAAPSQAAAAKFENCPRKPTTLAKSKFSVVWRQGSSLHLCTVEGRFKPATRRIGRWVPGTRVVLSGDDAGWTTPVAGGDRVSAADIAGRWLTGQRAVPATADVPSAEAKVARLVTTGSGAAWVTEGGGAVALAVEQPEGAPALGEEELSRAADAKAVLVGRDVPVPPALRLTQAGGDGDECGGSTTWSLDFGAAVPATWSGSYSTNAPACTG